MRIDFEDFHFRHGDRFGGIGIEVHRIVRPPSKPKFVGFVVASWLPATIRGQPAGKPLAMQRFLLMEPSVQMS